MTTTWEERIGAWLRSEQQRQAASDREGGVLRQQAKDLAASVDRIVAAQGRRAEESAARLKKLLAMQDDPVVLARNYGANRRVYHELSAPCGWVGYRPGFDEILLTEAIERGLRPCSSCGYLVGRGVSGR